jgi:hypothetical protein
MSDNPIWLETPRCCMELDLLGCHHTSQLVLKSSNEDGGKVGTGKKNACGRLVMATGSREKDRRRREHGCAFLPPSLAVLVPLLSTDLLSSHILIT